MLAPQASVLGLAVALDLVFGDPVYAAHPVRLIGATLSWFERGLRRVGADGYGGGVLLFLLLAGLWTTGTSALVSLLHARAPWAAWGLHLFVLYSLIALGDLVRHAWRVERALMRDDLPGARHAVGQLVGRDTHVLAPDACRRAAIESLSENLTDGFVSPLVWYAVAGLPGLVLFKVVSTMDSMVGFKTERYLRFGWCGARLDDLMNWLPARLTWLLVALAALLVPGCSAADALRVGWQQARLLPSPNSGWSEAATAGALRRRLVGPLWSQGRLVTDLWLGPADAPPAATHDDLRRAVVLTIASGLLGVAGVLAVLLARS
jgi:adenosylcobinamide-phosphate synthase